MIFSSASQPKTALIFLICGVLGGIIYSGLSLFLLLNFSKKIRKNIFFSVFYMFFIIFFSILLFFLNFGKPSLTLLSLYIVGFLYTKTATRKLVVILEKKWYNLKNNLLQTKKELRNEQSKKD